MRFALRWPRVRARGLVLTALLVVVAALLWRGAREQREAELLAAPLNPAAEQRLAGPAPVARFLDPASWL